MAKTERPLSILLLGTQMEYGGAQRMLLAQAEWFHQRGHWVQVAFLYDKQGLAEDWVGQYDFPVFNLDAWDPNRFAPFNLFNMIGGLRRSRQLMRGLDVVETFTSHSNLLGLPVARSARVPVRLATLHGYLADPLGLLPRIHGWLINSRITSRLVAVSEQVAQNAIKTERLKPAKLAVIPNGIPLGGQLLSTVEREAARAALGVPTDALLVMAVGRLVPVKGHAGLLRALAHLDGGDQLPYLVLVGEGELRDKLKAQARSLGLEDRVVFTGARQDADRLLQAADIYAQPSLREGLSIAMLEAMAAGLPMVASAVGAASDVVADNESGLLVPSGDEGALIAALEDLLADGEKRARLGAAARERVAAEYSLQRMCQAYETLMYQLLDEQHGD
jgi:glycosyltransferase involved in cell wall biosynthesis